MHEHLEQNRTSKTQWKAPHYGVGAALLVVGLLAGRTFFPLEIPKPFIVEKRVEVPVEVVRYVERVATAPVEEVVEAKAGSLVDGALFPSGFSHSKLLDSKHNSLRPGMRKVQVFGLVGQPYLDDGGGSLYYYSATSGMHLHLRFTGDELVGIIYTR